MSGFDVQMRSDAMIQQNRQFYDAQKHDAMSQMGGSIAQTGNALTQIMMQVQSRDMEARLRAQEMEINRQLQVEKLGMMREVHDVQMQQTQVEAAKLQVEAAKFEFEQRRKMYQESRDDLRFLAEFLPYAGPNDLPVPGIGIVDRSTLTEPQIMEAERLKEMLMGRGQAMAQERLRDNDPETERRLRAEAATRAFRDPLTGEIPSEVDSYVRQNLGLPSPAEPRQQAKPVQIDTSKATGLPEGYAEKAKTILGDAQVRSFFMQATGMDEQSLDSLIGEILSDENHPKRNALLQFINRMSGGGGSGSQVQGDVKSLGPGWVEWQPPTGSGQ